MSTQKSNILMVYPTFPPSYWGFQYVAPFLGKKSSMPPLGLLTIAALTPEGYSFRVVDLNCRPLTDEDLEWADLVCLSAMLPQKSSLFATAARCRAAGKLVVFGGPYPTACPEECAPHADVLVLNEGEITWPQFLQDFEAGRYKSRYTTDEKPDVTQTPVPRFDLLDLQDYICIPLQYSRGCPFTCEFCDIIVMFGRKPRTKTPEQMLAELDAVYETGYRGQIFIVDDNFIGNKKEARKLLKALVDWNIKRDYPFYFGTEASVNLADEPELLRLMNQAHFVWVFLGVETPVAESLKETAKVQNLKGTLSDKVKIIQRAGIQVFAGFMVGFDSDPDDIFDRQIDFINDVSVPNAMIGPLVALPGTPLYARMQRAGRLIESADGDEDRSVASGYSNIVTRIPTRTLLEGQRRVLQAIYTPAAYFERQLIALQRLPHPQGFRNRVRRALWLLVHFRVRGLLRSDETTTTFQSLVQLLKAYAKIPGLYYRAGFKFAWDVIRKCPDQLPWLPLSLFMGYHYYQFTHDHAVPGLTKLLEQLAEEESRRLEEPERLRA
jgi:radical SAM superfamily enzyme YgiQ (UPF0313 family)